MNEQNLTGPRITSGEQAASMGRKGGLIRSQRKKYAAQIRELKQKAVTDETIRKLISLVEDPDASAVDIVSTLKVAEAKATTSKEMSLVASVKTRFYQARFGELIKTQNTNLNVDVVTFKDFADINRKIALWVMSIALTPVLTSWN